MHHTLRYQHQFVEVSKYGRVFFTEGFIIKFLHKSNHDLEYAVRITKKQLKKAVARNFVKRRMRQLIHENKDGLSGWLLVIAKKEAKFMNYAQLSKDFREIVQQCTS